MAVSAAQVAATPAQHARAEALKSAAITGIALACGFVTEMATSGAPLHSPGDVLAYTKGHVLGFLVAQVIAPAWRGSAAYRWAKRNPAAA
jgi:hypothetical protein